MKTVKQMMVVAALAASCALAGCEGMEGAPLGTLGNTLAEPSGAVQAPASLAGARIDIGSGMVVLVMRSAAQGTVDGEEAEVIYRPHGASADFGYHYSSGSRRVYDYVLTSQGKGDLCQANHNRRPARLVFTSRQGKVYHGYLTGYEVISNQGELSRTFLRTPVTVTLR